MNACLYKSRIEAYLDGRLTGHDKDDVSRHVESCPACQAELQCIEQVDELFRSNSEAIFPLPDFDYWEDAAATIASRIATQKTPSAHNRAIGLREFLENLTAALAPTPVRFGLIGTAALVLFVLLVGYYQDLPTEKENVSLQAPSDPLAAPEQPREQGIPASDQELVSAPAESPAMDLSGELTNSDSPLSENRARVWPEPVTMPLRARLLAKLEPPRELSPVPAPVFIMLDEDQLDDDEVVTTPGSVALKVKGRRGSRSAKLPEQVAPLPVNESDFAETMWIVQESRTLVEKKNIWLSYVAREMNPTYLKMAYYNLALVLANLANDTKDPVLAQEAIDFYVEYESVLRPQMKQQRYNMKLKALQMIAKP